MAGCVRSDRPEYSMVLAVIQGLGLGGKAAVSKKARVHGHNNI